MLKLSLFVQKTILNIFSGTGDKSVWQNNQSHTVKLFNGYVLLLWMQIAVLNVPWTKATQCIGLSTHRVLDRASPGTLWWGGPAGGQRPPAKRPRTRDGHTSSRTRRRCCWKIALNRTVILRWKEDLYVLGHNWLIYSPRPPQPLCHAANMHSFRPKPQPHPF